MATLVDHNKTTGLLLWTTTTRRGYSWAHNYCQLDDGVCTRVTPSSCATRSSCPFPRWAHGRASGPALAPGAECLPDGCRHTALLGPPSERLAVLHRATGRRPERRRRAGEGVRSGGGEGAGQHPLCGGAHKSTSRSPSLRRAERFRSGSLCSVVCCWCVFSVVSVCLSSCALARISRWICVASLRLFFTSMIGRERSGGPDVSMIF